MYYLMLMITDLKIIVFRGIAIAIDELAWVFQEEVLYLTCFEIDESRSVCDVVLHASLRNIASYLFSTWTLYGKIIISSFHLINLSSRARLSAKSYYPSNLTRFVTARPHIANLSLETIHCQAPIPSPTSAYQDAAHPCQSMHEATMGSLTHLEARAFMLPKCTPAHLPASQLCCQISTFRYNNACSNVWTRDHS